jgi:hypothetical protein
MSKYVESHPEILKATQNPDGGWGYFPGKPSWLEPTAYALLALAEERGPAVDRGWNLLRSWQRPDGAYRACAAVDEPHWSTSLVVTLACVRGRVTGVIDETFERGLSWLLSSAGVEGRPFFRLVHWLRPSIVEFDPSLTGWPWEVGASSWVEPTAHALMALRCAARSGHRPDLAGRIEMAERMLLDRRCRDGGWNFGNRRVLGSDLPSYPETTALALMALDGHAAVRWGAALEGLGRAWQQTRSPLARAWLSSCLLTYRGMRPEPADRNGRAENDLLVTAIEGIRWDQILAA